MKRCVLVYKLILILYLELLLQQWIWKLKLPPMIKLLFGNALIIEFRPNPSSSHTPTTIIKSIHDVMKLKLLYTSFAIVFLPGIYGYHFQLTYSFRIISIFLFTTGVNRIRRSTSTPYILNGIRFLHSPLGLYG